MAIGGLPDFMVLVFATMLSKLILLGMAVFWLIRRGIREEAWEYENAWDSGWSAREIEAESGRWLLDSEDAEPSHGS